MAGPEVEIKLTLPVEHVVRLTQSPALFPAQASRRKKRLLSTYYDTPDNLLSQHGLHLRVRESGGSWIQTVKSTRAGLARGEWERAIGSPSPVTQMGDGSPADRLLERKKVLGSLAPAFRVDVQRTIWDLKLARADVEVALDEGTIFAGEDREALCEIELELKDGDGRTLFDLARALRTSAPVRLTLLSKGRRGYRLRAGKSALPEKAALPPLQMQGPAAEGARSVLMACVASLLLNLSLLAATPGMELVHQTRVALRRVRAALTLFGAVLGDERSHALRRDLGSLSDRLGAARDLDVFLASGLDGVDEAVRETVRAHASERREQAYAALATDLSSDAHFEVTLSLLELAETGDGEAAVSLEAFLARTMDRRFRKLVKASRGLQKLSEHERHLVRIRAKKLRYMIEFVEGEAPGKGFRCLRDTLEELQETLGKLNDAVVARVFAMDALSEAGVGDPESRLSAPPHARKRDHKTLDQARDARRRLARLKPFWSGWKGG
jgi:inorganic triphosphatase YgiF